MAGKDNLKGKGFESRTTEELREICKNGGKKSGETRRRKAAFKKCLNMMLTAEIYNEEWSPVLEAMGLESTLETLVNAAMIREALMGNVKAYEAIAKYSGQDCSTDKEQDIYDMRMKEMEEKIEKMRAERRKAEREQEDQNVEIKVEIDEDWST